MGPNERVGGVKGAEDIAVRSREIVGEIICRSGLKRKERNKVLSTA